MSNPRGHSVSRSSHTAELYEYVTRRLRWAVVLLILITMPLHQPQTSTFMVLIMLACLFNLSRYSSVAMRLQWYASRINFLIADNLLVAALIQVVGSPSTPYTLLIPMVVITATYWYGTRGAVIVSAFQVASLVSITLFMPLQPLAINHWQALILAGGLIITSALLLEQLTHAERIQRNQLQSLEREKDTSSSRLFALINSLGDAVATVDEAGHILVANNALNELSGTEDTLLGRQIGTVLPLKHTFKSSLNWSEAIRTAPSRYRDYTLDGARGKQINVELTITPIPNELGNNSEYIVLCHDVTQEKSLDEQRQEFIAVASHELRTPLAFIEGALSLTLSSPDEISNAETRTFLQKAYDNVRFLSQLVDDLTLLSKAQNDALEIQPQVVDPKTIIDRLIAEYASSADAKGLTLKSDVMPKVTTILTTEYHVEQILRNLISNAIKYTASGEVVVRVEPSQNNSVLFSVRDTGPGISQADQKKLFTKYFRSENYQTRQTGGTGLGLYICQEITKRIDGKLWCVSKAGHGATFYLEVPPFSKLSKDQKEVVAAGVNDLVNQL